MNEEQTLAKQLIDFAQASCSRIGKPQDNVISNVSSFEIEFFENKKVPSFPEEFRSMQFWLEEKGLFGWLSVECFSIGRKNDVEINDVKFFKYSKFGKLVRKFYKKQEKLYRAQELILSKANVKEFLSQSTFKPNRCSKPGDTISDIMEEKCMTTKCLAEKLGKSEQFVLKLINADIKISPLLALDLSKELGPSAVFWYRREFHYRECLQGRDEIYVG